MSALFFKARVHHLKCSFDDTHVVEAITDESEGGFSFAVQVNKINNQPRVLNAFDGQEHLTERQIVDLLCDLDFTTAVCLSSFAVVTSEVVQHSSNGRSEAEPVVLNIRIKGRRRQGA